MKDREPNPYVLPDEKRSCDKLHHFMRSLFHQPNHKKHLTEEQIAELQKKVVSLEEDRPITGLIEHDIFIEG